MTTSQQVINLVKQGNLEAIRAVRQAGRDTGEVLTMCVNLINLSVIVIGGSMAQAREHLIAGVREVVYSRSNPLATQHLQIVQSSGGVNAAILGASMLAIHYAPSPDRIEAMGPRGSAPDACCAAREIRQFAGVSVWPELPHPAGLAECRGPLPDASAPRCTQSVRLAKRRRMPQSAGSSRHPFG